MTQTQTQAAPLPHVTYGSGGGVAPYAPPRLFPALRNLPEGDLRFDYIWSELERLCNEGTLCLTDILAQPSDVRDAVGLALRGQVIDPETHQQRLAAGQPLGHVLSTRIKVRLIPDPMPDGKPTPGRPTCIKFKAAVKQDPRGWLIKHGQKQLTTGASKLGVSLDPDVGWRNTQPKYEPVWHEYQGLTEVALPIQDAWVALSQHGKYCVRAASLRAQHRRWLFVEAAIDDREKAAKNEDAKNEDVKPEEPPSSTRTARR